MNPDYSIQFLKLAGKCFAWIGGLAFIGGVLAVPFMGRMVEHSLQMWVPILFAGFACFYAAIPIAIFSTFVITLRAFGRKP